MKYLPIAARPVDAEFWDSTDPVAAKAMLELLIKHGRVFNFDTEESGWNIHVEVHKANEITCVPEIVIVDRSFLVVHEDGTLENMSQSAFASKYREGS